MIPETLVNVELPYRQEPFVELARASGYIRGWDWAYGGYSSCTSKASSTISIYMFNANKDSRLHIALDQFYPGGPYLDINREVELVLRALTVGGGFIGTKDPLDIASIEVFPLQGQYKVGKPEKPWMASAPNVWELQLRSKLGYQEVSFPDSRPHVVHMDLDTILKVCAHPLELVLRYAHPLPDKPLPPKEPTMKSSHTFEVYFETEHTPSSDTKTVGNHIRQAIYDRFNKKSVDGFQVTSMNTILKEEKLITPKSWKDVLDGNKLSGLSHHDIADVTKKAGYQFFAFSSSIYYVNAVSTIVGQASDLT